MYTILEADIDGFSQGYSDELKKELDKRLEDLKSGKSKSISAEESKKRIEEIMNPERNDVQLFL